MAARSRGAAPSTTRRRAAASFIMCGPSWVRMVDSGAPHPPVGTPPPPAAPPNRRGPRCSQRRWEDRNGGGRPPLGATAAARRLASRPARHCRSWLADRRCVCAAVPLFLVPLFYPCPSRGRSWDPGRRRHAAWPRGRGPLPPRVALPRGPLPPAHWAVWRPPQSAARRRLAPRVTRPRQAKLPPQPVAVLHVLPPPMVRHDGVERAPGRAARCVRRPKFSRPSPCLARTARRGGGGAPRASSGSPGDGAPTAAPGTGDRRLRV